MRTLLHALDRLGRMPGRIRDDCRIIKTSKNWPEVLSSKWKASHLPRLVLRDGVVLSGPGDSRLSHLFHEIWVKECYTSVGYRINTRDIIIDIGANIGVFAIYAATRAPEGKVYAYEPFPGSLDWLRRNIEKSLVSNITVFPLAVSSTEEMRMIYVTPGNMTINTLIQSGRGDDGFPVACIGLDQIMESNRIGRCDLLKLDCEGSEYEILEGCSRGTLSHVRRIVGEYHEGPGIAGSGEGLRHLLRSRAFEVEQFGAVGAGCGLFRARNLKSD
jgi:FkbM family methyltransferase